MWPGRQEDSRQKIIALYKTIRWNENAASVHRDAYEKKSILVQVIAYFFYFWSVLFINRNEKKRIWFIVLTKTEIRMKEIRIINYYLYITFSTKF